MPSFKNILIACVLSACSLGFVSVASADTDQDLDAIFNTVDEYTAEEEIPTEALDAQTEIKELGALFNKYAAAIQNPCITASDLKSYQESVQTILDKMEELSDGVADLYTETGNSKILALSEEIQDYVYLFQTDNIELQSVVIRDYTSPINGALPLDTCFWEGMVDYTEGNTLDSTSAISNAAYSIADVIRYLIGAIALFLGVMAALEFILARGNEDKVTKSKQWFVWAAVGMIVFSLAEPLAAVFTTGGESFFLQGDNISSSAGQLTIVIQSVITFVRYILGGLAVYFTAASGFKLVIFPNDESTIEEQKKVFSWGILGVILFMIAPEFVQIFYGRLDPESGIAYIGTDYSSGNATFVSLANLILSLFSGIAVLAFVLAALYYAMPGGEDNKSKAKQIMIGTVVALVLAFSSWVIINEIVRATS